MNDPYSTLPSSEKRIEQRPGCGTPKLVKKAETPVIREVIGEITENDTLRVKLPPDLFGQVFPDAQHLKGFITIYLKTNSLILMSEDNYQWLEGRAKKIWEESLLGRHFCRMTIGNAEKIHPEGMYIEIPVPLKNFAGLTEKLILVGKERAVHIWDREVFEAYCLTNVV